MRTESTVSTALLISITVLLLGCSETDAPSKQALSRQSNTDDSRDLSGNTANSDTSDPSVVRSQMCFRTLNIQQYHIGQEPVHYPRGDLSRVRLYYSVRNSNTGAGSNWSIQKVEVLLKDGSVKTHTPLKGMSVAFTVTAGRGLEPVMIEQYFSRDE